VPKTYLYLITRKDLSKQQQAIQLAHAATEHAYRFGRPIDHHPSFVALAVKDKEELQVLQKKLEQAGLPTAEFTEPYNNWGLTAVSCSVLQEQRFLFAEHKLWSLA
jgi:Peptidyl-tRNA hydrolase PTH2